MPLIKDIKLPLTPMQRRVQAAAWVGIYGGLLTLLTGYTLQDTRPTTGWHTAHSLMLVGSLVTALGVALVYIRSRMK
jgi:hypothetical protein